MNRLKNENYVDKSTNRTSNLGKYLYIHIKDFLIFVAAEEKSVEENEIEDETLARAKIVNVTFYRGKKKILSKIGQSGKENAKVWKEGAAKEGKKKNRGRIGQSRSRKNSNPIEFHGWSRGTIETDDFTSRYRY